MRTRHGPFGPGSGSRADRTRRLVSVQAIAPTGVSTSGARSEPLGPAAVVTAAGLSVLVDSTSFRLTPIDQLAFVAFVAVAVAVALTAWAQQGLPPGAVAGVVGYGLLLVVPLIPLLARTDLALAWTFADLSTMAAPAAVFVATLCRPDILSDRRHVRTVAIFMSAAAVAAATVGSQPGTHRHLPPATLLVSGAWVAMICGTTRLTRLAGLAGVATTLLFILHSGNRTSVAIWGAVGGLVTLRRIGAGRLLMGLALLGTVATAWVALGDPAVTTASFTEGTRFEDLDRAGGDESAQARVREGADVRDNMADWSAIHHLVGDGHGATWTPDRQLGFWRGDEYHAIHLGHLRTWYRYGLLGFVPIIGLLAVAVAVYRRSPRHPRDLADAMPLVVSTSALLWTADFVVRNPMTTASASLTCGWVAALWWTGRTTRERC